MIFTIFILFKFFNFVTSEGYICSGNILRNPPLDLNEPYYFPENWNEGQDPPVYKASQNCNWQINMLDGIYATVTFYKYSKKRNDIYCTYPNGKTDFILDNDTAPYIFTTPKFEIDLQAKDTEGLFAFKVVWSYYPSQICKTPISLAASELFPSAPSNCLTTYTAPHKVLLIGFALADIAIQTLRLSAVYEGDSIDGKYIGNVLDAFKDNVVSEGDQLTVYTFGKVKSNHTLFLGMDSEATGGINHFTGLDCSDYAAPVCYIKLSSANGLSAVITASPNIDYLKLPTSFPTNSNLKIYEGQINDDHLWATINKTNFMNVYPIAVKRTVKTYTLDIGSENIQIVRNPNDVAYLLLYAGRYVKIHSFAVGEFSYNQDTIEKFTTGSTGVLMNFNWNVSYFEVLNDDTTTLEITVSRAGNVVFYDKYSGGNHPPPTMFRALGDSINVSYRTYGGYTKGFIVELQCTANDRSSTEPSATTTTIATTKTIASKVTSIATTLSSSVGPTTSKTSTTEKHETTTSGSSGKILNFLFLLPIMILVF